MCASASEARLGLADDARFRPREGVWVASASSPLPAAEPSAGLAPPNARKAGLRALAPALVTAGDGWHGALLGCEGDLLPALGGGEFC